MARQWYDGLELDRQYHCVTTTARRVSFSRIEFIRVRSEVNTLHKLTTKDVFTLD